ncbi:azurin [Roseibacillus persicicus]|uniref:Azurin n=2 Tax=Roseibacillus persicicus TaxID=454148 RepID=A0A918TQS9_9BACT|nr:azurin [Roseibacillus persicicus]
MIATGVALAAQVSMTFAQDAATKEAPAAEEAKKADVEVTIEGNDTMQFDKKEFTVKEGQTVALTFKNVGKLPKAAMGHNVVIVKPGTVIPSFAMDCMPNAQTTGLPQKQEYKDAVVASTKILGPGESETVTFTAPAPGKYDYICTFTGHFGVMKGVMTVEAK